MIDCPQSIAPDEIKRILWLVILGGLVGTRFHRMGRKESRKDQLLSAFLAHYSHGKVGPADAHASLRLMLHKEPIKLIDIHK